MTEQIQDNIVKKIPFILFENQKNYARFYPAILRYRTYENGECIGEHTVRSEEEFTEAIENASLVLPNLFTCQDEAPRAYGGTEEAIVIEEPEAEDVTYEEDKE